MFTREELVSNSASIMMTNSVMMHIRYIGPITLPVEDDVAKELFRRMNERFQEYTGRGLWEYGEELRHHT